MGKNTNVEVRNANIDDVSSIRDVARRSWEETYSHMLHEETIAETVNDWYSREILEEEVGMDDSILLVGEDDEGVVGFLHGIYIQDRKEGHVLRLYVDPDHRRRGIGKNLFENAMGRFEKFGVRMVRGMVFERNEGGNEFYEKLGFEQVDKGEVEIDDETVVENVYSKELE